jgi:hypothetical protein
LNQLKSDKLNFKEEIESKNIAENKVVENKMVFNDNYKVESIIDH